MMTSLLFVLANLTRDPDLRIPAVLNDHMVIQRNSKFRVWGWDTPGTSVKIKASWAKDEVIAYAGKFGEFSAEIPTSDAGGPYNISISGSENIQLQDILIGDVWVCSGQSNMEWPLAATSSANEDIQNANQPRVRLFQVSNVMEPSPKADCVGKWATCSPEAVKDFSAIAYLFAKELNEKTNVPIGVIDTTWGGTEAELWTSEEGLKRMPDFAAKINNRAEAQEKAQKQFAAWENEVHAKDLGWGKWWDPAFDDTSWTPMNPLVPWSQSNLKGFDGYVWFRSTVTLDESDLKSGAKLELGSIDDNDETWINGEKIGATAGWSTVRNYSIPSNILKAGKNSIAVRVFDGIGEGGFANPSPSIRFTNGKNVQTSGWRWMKGPSTSEIPAAPQVDAPRNSLLFNGMISPLLNFPIKGAIWYQGESNVGRAFQYRRLFPAMIQDWRRQWHSQFPFYFVQIAPFTGYGTAAAAELREAQNEALKLAKTGVVVVTDATGNLEDIHPQDKRTPAHRLVLWALANDYKQRGFEFSGPLYASHRVAGNTIRVKFSHSLGLQSLGGPLKEFEIAGTDRVWRPAKAHIDVDTVVVTSPEVARPVAVRMGWSTACQPNLFNQANLPASPFRTDKWPGLTDNNKW